MLRTLVKDAAARAVSFSRLDAVAHASRYRRLPFVVAYHRVVEQLNAFDGRALPAMEISVAMLEAHLDWLGRRFRIISLDELQHEIDRPRGGKPASIVTFDDGYRDVFDHGFPLLKRKGMPAGIFVVTDIVGTTELPVHERLFAKLAAEDSDPFATTQRLLRTLPREDVEKVIGAESGRPARSDRASRPMTEMVAERDARRLRAGCPLSAMTWEMLRAMQSAGMTIGSHSKTHAFLTNETKPRIREEAATSRRDLQKKLNTDIQCFAYPGGTFNDDVLDAIDEAGYRFAFTTCRHRDERRPLLTIPRTMFWERSCLGPAGGFSSAIMSCHAAGAFDWRSSCTPSH